MKLDLLVNGDAHVFTMNGGCYKNDEPGYYTRALKNKTYDFNYVPVEVRNSYDPYTLLTKNNYEFSRDTSYYLYIAYACIGVSIFMAFGAYITYNKRRGVGDDN